MIETLHIENFQSLQTVDIELGRFTVLVGPSNSGKSAIRRAIEALIHNDPPAGRLREGCPAYVVSMMADGVPVSIHKATKATTYQVGSVLIEKPGATCPPPVLELLRLSDTNFASQFDLPYLLAETPSAVARALGELTNISVLFEGIREATRRQRESGKRAKVLGDQVDVLADKLAVYADLPDEKAKLDDIHVKLTAAFEAASLANDLYETVAAVIQFEGTVTAESELLAQQPDWDYLEGTMAAVEATLNEASMTEGAHSRARQLEDKIRTAQDELGELIEGDIDFDAIDAALKLAERSQDAYTKAYSLGGVIATAAQQAAPSAEELAAEKELAGIDTCPLCGSVTGVGLQCA